MPENLLGENGQTACLLSNSGVGSWAPEFIRENSGLLSPTIILFSVVAAIFGIATQRYIARRRATLDLIEKYESTEFYQELNEAFSSRRKNLQDWKDLQVPTEKEFMSERSKILAYLNHYELVAIGIENKILDEKFYRNWMKTPYTRDWDAAAGFVNRDRWRKNDGSWEYNSKLYENFRLLAIKWGAKNNIQKGNPPTD